MRRSFAVSLSVLLLFLSGCGASADPAEYLSMPFSGRVKLTIDSSEFLLDVTKGGANLVSVTVVSPEALEGLTASLGEENEISFRGIRCADGMPRTIAGLIYEAFDARNAVSVSSDGSVDVLRFSSSAGDGELRIDSFSAVPISLCTDGVEMIFIDFKR